MKIKRRYLFDPPSDLRRRSVAVAVAESVAMVSCRIIFVVVRAEVVPDFVRVRKHLQAVCVHYGVGILFESRSWGVHCKPKIWIMK